MEGIKHFSPELNSLVQLCKGVLGNDKYQGTVLSNMDLIKAHRIELFLPKSILPTVCTPQLCEQLIARKHNFTMKYLRFQKAIQLLTDNFNKIGVEMLVLKGIPLNHILFGNQVTRNSRDIDILIKEKDVFRINNCLVKMGFQRVEPAFEIAEKQQQLFLQEFDQLVYYSKELRCQVEIHWKLFRNKGFLPLSHSEIWNNTQTVDVNGLKIKTLSNDLLSIYVSLHGAQHRWDSLIWIIDLFKFNKILSKTEFESAINYTEKYKCTATYLLGFYMAKIVLGARTPDYISAYFSPEIKKRAEACMEFIALHTHPGKRPPTLKRLLFSYRANASFKGKTHHLYTFPHYSLNYLNSNKKIIHWLCRPITLMTYRIKNKNSPH